jgi:hypothetical protein
MPLLRPPAPTVAKRKYYIRIGEPLAVTLPRERNRNCEEPVKGQARWRGSLRSPLTELRSSKPTRHYGSERK